MGRLDCKDPSIVAWAVLERSDVSYETLSEEEGEAAAKALAMRGVETTPSGAAGYAALQKGVTDSVSDKGFRPLVFISEGPA